MKRYLEDIIINDALSDRKMAFLYGPRQVGKTTIAKNLLKKLSQIDNYYTFDSQAFKKIWLKNIESLVIQNIHIDPVLVFDEIHKDKKWKNKIKGLYDLYNDEARFLVTGSARLDMYRKSGDSLLGRYLPYRVHPFSLGEGEKNKPPPENDWLEHASQKFDFEDLMHLSGFPEPLLGGSKEKAKRWSRLQTERLIKEDLRDLSNVKDINAIETLSILLQSKVGSQLSYKSLEEDLQCSHTALKHWLSLLESVYYSYIIRPYSKNVKRSIKKEPKLYLYNWSVVENEGAKYENLVASHLLKSCHYWTDCAFGEFDLFYLRDKDKREVDFLVTRDKKPYLLLEVKSDNNAIQPSTLHFYNLLKPKFAFQVVRTQKIIRKTHSAIKNPIEIMQIEKFLSALC